MVELARLKKLIERKREYLTRCDNQKVKDAVTAEINIIEGFIQAVSENESQYSELFKESEQFMQKQIVLIDALITICQMHGINDFEELLKKGLPLLRNEFLHDLKENYIRVPNQLRTTIYGEKH